MPGMSRKTPGSSIRKRGSKASQRKNVKFEVAPNDLASLIRGLYHRVALQLDVDPSYVSRVARRERRSRKIEGALRSELTRIVEYVNKRRGARRKAALKKSRKDRNKNTGRRS